ncbi:hypothetical protein ULF88_24870 [Halopseudomonas pachastrellae]|nr:hypothetical protein [Halopseudomonas pachastrellae]
MADSYEKDAVREIRGNGAIAATLDSLFGTDVAQALHELASVLKATALSLGSPEKIDALFSALGKIQGAEGTLRGCLFEYLCAELANETYRNPTIRINKLVRGSDGARAEVDVFVECRAEVVLIECKGHLPLARSTTRKLKNGCISGCRFSAISPSIMRTIATSNKTSSYGRTRP